MPALATEPCPPRADARARERVRVRTDSAAREAEKERRARGARSLAADGRRASRTARSRVEWRAGRAVVRQESAAYSEFDAIEPASKR